MSSEDTTMWRRHHIWFWSRLLLLCWINAESKSAMKSTNSKEVYSSSVMPKKQLVNCVKTLRFWFPNASKQRKSLKKSRRKSSSKERRLKRKRKLLAIKPPLLKMKKIRQRWSRKIAIKLSIKSCRYTKKLWMLSHSLKPQMSQKWRAPRAHLPACFWSRRCFAWSSDTNQK